MTMDTNGARQVSGLAGAWTITQFSHWNPTSPAAIAALIASSPEFGTVFSDHMAVAQWSEAEGWHDLKIMARKRLEMDPASPALHYGQEVFEGLKAYRGPKGEILLFRPDRHARRFVASAERLVMQPVPEDLFLRTVKALVSADRDWVPSGERSLYIRPFLLGTASTLGVKPSSSYRFYVIASPVGPYFKGAPSTITVWVTRSHVRAAPGGTGAVKCGGNYAAGMQAQEEARRHGCHQVVFLDAAERKWVEELQSMNLFFLLDGECLATPPLTDTILPGVTRASIIEFAEDFGIRVEERRYSFDEWRSDAESDRLTEAFACGTAANVAAIGTVRYEGGEFAVGDGMEGPVAKKIRERLTGIQRGEIEDTRGWVHRVG